MAATVRVFRAHPEQGKRCRHYLLCAAEAIPKSTMSSLEGLGGHLGRSLHGVRLNWWRHMCARPPHELLWSIREFL